MKIGFIGCGNMGTAIIEGIFKSKLYKGSDIIAFDLDFSKLEKLSSELGINTADNIKTLVSESDLLFLAVKPDVYSSVTSEIKDVLNPSTIIVSIAAGQTISNLESSLGSAFKIIRVMPNTPALVGEGMSAVCGNKNASKEDIKIVLDIFNSIGRAIELKEKLFDAVVAVSGSSPAYIYMLIEAMADSAVAFGMPRALAYEFASQAVLGSAKMVIETKRHPADLKDMVCSPSGTTIDAVMELEKCGFRGAVISAMEKCAKKSIKMSK